MSRINQLTEHQNSVVEGQYLLRHVVDRETQHGDRYKVLNLVDCTGELRVFVWERSGFIDGVPLTMPCRVHVSLCPRYFNNSIVADLLTIRVLETHEVSNAAALLCRDDCPSAAQPALAKLVALNETLDPPALRGFLNRVLLDDRIGPALLHCKASLGHHHSEPGGLLSHSIQVMEIAADMAGDRLTDMERSIVQVAGLLHDLGKLRAVGSGRVRPVHYKLLRHETQTHRLLEPHLEWLRAQAPDMTAGLDYILDYLSQRRSERGFAEFLGAELIACADQMSAALTNNRRLTDLLRKTLPAGQWRALTQRAEQNSQTTQVRLHGKQR